MSKRVSSLAAWCVCLGTLSCLPSCTGIETGNPRSASLGLGVWSSTPDRVAAAPATAPIVVESLWLYIDRIDYETCSGDQTASVLVEPQAIDLLSSMVQDVSARLGNEDYCQAHVYLARAADLPAAAPALLDNAAVLVTGRRTDGAPFEIVGNFTEQFDPATSGPALNAQASAALLLGVDVGRLLSSIDVDGAAPLADGVVRFEFSDASGGQGPLVDALNSAWSLHFDANDNARIDEDEPDVSLR
jgi:hypothetical protein